MDHSSIASFWTPIASLSALLALTLVLELRGIGKRFVGEDLSRMAKGVRRFVIFRRLFLYFVYLAVGVGLITTEVTAVRAMAESVAPSRDSVNLAVVSIIAAVLAAISIPLGTAGADVLFPDKE